MELPREPDSVSPVAQLDIEDIPSLQMFRPLIDGAKSYKAEVDSFTTTGNVDLDNLFEEFFTNMRENSITNLTIVHPLDPEGKELSIFTRLKRNLVNNAIDSETILDDMLLVDPLEVLLPEIRDIMKQKCSHLQQQEENVN